jgi:hypothetical protein
MHIACARINNIHRVWIARKNSFRGAERIVPMAALIWAPCGVLSALFSGRCHTDIASLTSAATPQSALYAVPQTITSSPLNQALKKVMAYADARKVLI